MRQFLLIFMCLTACLTLGRGSIAHAMAPDFPDFVVGAPCIAHHDGDRAHNSACKDSNKAATHHHAACHGHKIGTPPTGGALIVAAKRTLVFTPTLAGLAPDARPDVAIRPPNA